jgi:RNA polymerase sigma factor for flagellar operon FliA
MNDERRVGEELFSRRFRQIEQIIHRVAARHRLHDEENQELYSLVMLKMVQDDYAVLRGFQEKSRWGTYLIVVVQRVLLDHRVREWGRWRPCALARRLGPTAVELDRRINRDGREPEEAVRELSTRGVGETPTELEKLAARIPRRTRRRFLSGDKYLKLFADRETADRRVEAAELRRAGNCLSAALASALQDLPEQERNLLGLRFGRGWTVRRIAASLGLEERPLYRRFNVLLRRLRRRLERLGLGREEVARVLDSRKVDLEIGLR